MPNSGPSRACQVCRSRKVKCDEAEPACQRCIKAGVQCPGYPEEWDFMFRDMTSIAESKVKSRVGWQSKSHSQTPQPAISPPVSTNWKEVAIPRFFANYVSTSRIVLEGDLRWLPEMCEGPNVSECLKEGLDAVAWLSIANQVGLDWLALEAQGAYAKAVGLVAGLLQDEEAARLDSTLAANCLFGLFEQISGFKYSSSNWSPNRHMPGRASLLRLRGTDHFDTQVGRSLFRLSYSSIQTKSIHDHSNPTAEAETWLDSFPPSAHDPQLQLARCNLRTARLCAEAQDLVQYKLEEVEWILAMLRIIKDAIVIDESYQEWEESHFESWRPRNIRRNPSPSKDSPERRSPGADQQLYDDVQIAGMWNNWRGVRIHLNEVLIRCCALATAHTYSETLDLDFTETESRSRALISELVADICASVSFCLGEIDSSGNPGGDNSQALGGYLMLFPLTVARSSTREDEQKRMWFNKKLGYISDKMGVRMGQMILDQPVKDPWDLSCAKPEAVAA